ncbi:MAG TPA: regulatory protein RecX [Methylomirabilota bacterium]
MPAPGRQLDARRARLAAADLLSRRPWTAAELTRRLRRRGAPADVADAVVADLRERGHVDDAAFARHWVETRAARGYGAARLRAELRGRGVALPAIERALASLVADTALDQARAVARRRLPALRRAAPERAAARLRDHLLRRGYAAPVVARVVRETIDITTDD